MLNTETTNRTIKVFLTIIIAFFTIGILAQEIPEREKFLTITPTSASFGAKGGSKKISVSSSSSWKISSTPASWIRASKDGKSLSLYVEENKGTASRSVSILLTSSDDKTIRLSVKQDGAPANTPVKPDKSNSSDLHSPSDRRDPSYLLVSQNNLNFSSDGGTKTITINASGAWQVETNESNSHVHLAKNGNQLKVTLDPNKSTSRYTYRFAVRMGNLRKYIDVSQEGHVSTLSVSSDNLHFAHSGGSEAITITTNENWQIETRPDPSWVHLYQDGNHLTIEVEKTLEKTGRTDRFTIKAGNLERQIQISQEGMPTRLSVYPESLNFSSSGGLQSIIVSSNREWKVSTGTTRWGHLSRSRDGNSLYVRVDKYKKSTPREDYIELRADDKKVRINISQDGRNRGPFNHAVDNYSAGLSFGYIQKQWECDIDGETVKEGVFSEDKFMNGVQMGFRIQPQFGAGFGINTGLFYEFCWAKSDKMYDEYGTYDMLYKEHGLYMPAHLKFTMNFSRWFQLSIYGGAGLNYVVSGRAEWKDYEDSDSWDVYKDNDLWKRFNPMLEYGASIRIRRMQFDFTMSKGLRNWAADTGETMKVGRPMSISTTICF